MRAQCPDLIDEVVDGVGEIHCEGDPITMSLDGTNIPPGTNIDFYVTDGTQSPYQGFGVFVGSVPVIQDECNNEPEVLYIMVNPDNAQIGSGNDKCDEFIILWTGSGGFNTTDITVTNLSNGSFQWTNFVAGNAEMASCGTSLPPGPVPPNSILIIQGSPVPNLVIDIDDLCAEGLPVYIIANNDFTCTGGWFDNDSPCSSCPVEITIDGDCDYYLELDYMPPSSSTNGWGWSNQGSGIFQNIVPPLNIPEFDPGSVSIEDFTWIIPDNWCEDFNFENTFLIGVLNPPPPPNCFQEATPWFGLSIACGELSLSGGGEICEGNCPDAPNFIEFSINSNNLPLTVDLVVSSSVFPSFPINDLVVTDGQHMDICLGGLLPSFDPGINTLTIPSLAIGLTAEIQVVSAVTANGCEVNLNTSSIELEFIQAPIANAGPDQSICSHESVNVNGSIQGSATQSEWTSDGDGSFANPNALSTVYTPGPQDIATGNVVLTLNATDENGACIPATSSLQVFIDQSIIIETNSPLTVCNTDVATIAAMMTGPNEPGMWETTGDGEFDDPSDPTTVYTPGFNDLADGSVTLFFNLTDPDVCVQSSEPLVINFVNAPDVTVPADIEICQNETAGIMINVTGDYTSITWNAIGDGQLTINNNMDITYAPGPQDIDDQFTIVQVIVVSSFAECGQTTYNIPINIIDCNCPPLITDPPVSELCYSSDTLVLSTLLNEGGPGTWTITSAPPGVNPATIQNGSFITSASDHGSYTVTYTLTNPEPGCPSSSSEVVIVSPFIQPDLGTDVITCSGEPVNINVVFNIVVPTQFEWETSGDGNFTSENLLNAVYTPGPGDEGQNVMIVYHVPEGGCAPQSDTVFILYQETPFATFVDDTISICNEADKGSVLDFPSFIIGGNSTGQWSNISGIPVDLSNPSSVDFVGIAEGFYQFGYRTAANGPCPETDYIITVSVMDCACPFINAQPLPTGICNDQATVNLNAFIMAGAPGMWEIVSQPVGPNPATLNGPILQTLDALQGEYLVRFTFNTAPIVGCPDSAEIEVTIQDLPGLVLQPDLQLCDIQPIDLNSMISGSAIDVQWTSTGSGAFSNSIGTTTTYTPSVVDLMSGGVTLIGTSIDTLGFCAVASDSVIVDLGNPPKVTLSQDTASVCNDPVSGSLLNLAGFIIEADPGTWVDINNSGVDLSDLSTIDFNGVAPGAYVFEYTTTSAVAPCTNITVAFTVFVKDCSCPPFQIGPIPTILCTDDIFNLDDLVIDAEPGEWSIEQGPPGNWPVISNNDLVLQNSVTGTYLLAYALFDSIPGCRATMFLNFTLESAPLASNISYDCDEVNMTYEVSLATDAATVEATAGTLMQTGPGLYVISDIPNVDFNIILTSSSGNCINVLDVSPPNCNCTLEIEDLSDTIWLCPGDTLVLIPLITGAQGLPFSTWIGETTVMKPSFPVFKAGNYVWIVRDSAGCEERDSFTVALIEELILDYTTIPPTCEGLDDGQIVIEEISGGIGPYTVQIDGGPLFISSVWPDSIDQIGVGLHEIIITDVSGCENVFHIEVEDGSPGIISLGPDITISLGDSVLIPTQISDIDIQSLSWTPVGISNGSAPFWFKPNETTTITVTVTDVQGCIYSDDKTITIFVEQHFYVPNTFSPNGDGFNDLFQVFVSANAIDIKSMEIYDRWGNQVFRSIDLVSPVWNGTFDGKPLQQGVYVVKLAYEDADGDPHVFWQDLTLIR